MFCKSKIVTTKTPFRVNFFGGGTDLPSYFNENEGAVLGTTIDKYSYVTINSLERLLEKKIRISYSSLELVDHPEEVSHDIIRSILLNYKNEMNDVFVDIHSYADLPSGTGIGSSSSFAVGFLNALHLLFGRFKRADELAKEAIHFERNVLNEAGGWQDQVHAAFGGFNKIKFYSNNFDVNPVFLREEIRNDLQSSLCFYFTGQTRSSSGVHKKIVTDKDKYNYLKAMKNQVEEGQSILVGPNSGNEMLKNFGQLLNEAWSHKKSLSKSISTSVIDEMYDVAMANGAYGGKLLGAGGGGFFLFIVPPENQPKFNESLSALKKVPIRMVQSGSQFLYSN